MDEEYMSLMAELGQGPPPPPGHSAAEPPGEENGMGRGGGGGGGGFRGRGRGRGAKQNAAPQQMSDLMPQHFTAAGGKGSPKTKMARIPKITERVSLPTPDSLGLAGMQVGKELFFEF